MKKLFYVFLLLFLALNLILKVPIIEAEEANGNISFQPNVIPNLKIHFVDEFFRFQWLDNRFDLKLLINCENENHSLRDFWEKMDRVVKWKMLKDKATDSMYEFGYMIEDIPQEIADKVEYLVWKIEGASFDVDEIEVEEIEVFEEGYNITRFHLPDNLVLSYEDLWLYNFTVSHPNNHETIVKGVHGRTEWNLDPITFSSPIITVVGESGKGDSWANAYDRWDVWNASDANGWEVANKTDSSENTQYDFGCRLQIGDGSTHTYFWDKNIQVTYNSTASPARYDPVVLVKLNGHLRYGTLTDATKKTSKEGISSIVLVNLYDIYHVKGEDGAGIELYSSHFYSHAYRAGIAGYDAKIYNCILNKVDLGGDLFDADVYNVIVSSAYYGFRACSFTSCDKLTIQDTYAYGMFYRAYTQDLKNVKIVSPALDTFMGYQITTDKHLINPDVEAWTFLWIATSTAEVYRQYTFDLSFTFENGSYAEGTNVTISNSILGTSDSWILTANGSIPQQTYSMGHYNQTGGDTIYDYNPYNIIATLDGCQTYTQLINVTKKEDLTIALIQEDEYPPIARYIFNPSNPIPPSTVVHFNASETLDIDGTITDYYWNFGDGYLGSSVQEPLMQENMSITYIHGYCYYNNYVYGCEHGVSDGRVVKAHIDDYTDKTIVQIKRNGSDATSLVDIIEANGYLWATGGGGYLYKINSETLTTEAYFQILPNKGIGLCYDGSFIYGCDIDGYLAKFNITDETHSNNWMMPGGSFAAIVEDGDYLYVSDIANKKFRKAYKSTLVQKSASAIHGYSIADDIAQDDLYIYGGIEEATGGIIRLTKSSMAIYESKNGEGTSFGVFLIDNNTTLVNLDKPNTYIWVYESQTLDVIRYVELTGLKPPNTLGLIAPNDLVEVGSYLHLSRWYPVYSPIFKLSKYELLGWTSGITPTHSYATEGNYTVTLVVIDDDGFSDTFSQIINVEPLGVGAYGLLILCILAPVAVISFLLWRKR